MNTPSIFPSAQRRTGSALVIVLGMLSVLLLMGVAFSVTMRTERAAAANKRHADMARHILDSALARTMSDLDAQLEGDGDLPVPRHTVVAVSEKIDEDSESTSVNLLSHELVRHLPPDHLAAALVNNDYQSPRAYWRPIYGDVRIHHSDANTQTDEDSPVGRYAYVVLNGCGYLDPNFIGSSNRFYGTSAAEMQLGDTPPSDGSLKSGETYQGFESRGTLFGEKVKTGRTGQGVSVDLSDVKDRFGKDNHYATMRDFLRASVTNALKMAPFDSENASLVSTNSFGIGGFALDEFAPPSGTKDGFAIRKPKLSLTLQTQGGKIALKDPNDFTDFEFGTMADYFERAFSLSGEALEDNISAGKDNVSPSLVAARALLDALDTDFLPGPGEHTVNDLNKSDEYLAALGKGNVKWHALPCTEPVPLLDSVLFLAGTDDTHPGLELNPNVHTNRTTTGEIIDVVTNGYKATITLGVAQNSACYSGWNIPKSVEGKTFYHHWFFSGPEAVFSRNSDQSKYEAFKTGFRQKVESLSMNRAEGSITVKMQGTSSRPGVDPVFRADFMPASTVWTIQDIELPDAQTEDEALDLIPDEFGIDFSVNGFLFLKGGAEPRPESDTLVECVPTIQENGSGYGDDNLSDNSKLEAHVCFKKSLLEKLVKKPKGERFTLESDQPHFVGAIYCLDPVFGYNKGSWIPTAGCGASPAELQEVIAWDGEMNGEKPDGWIDPQEGHCLNPLSYAWLSSPRHWHANYDGLTVGGECDVMWAYADDGDVDDLPESAGKSFYLDPEDTDEGSPYAFTRVGQLGFLPIGTRRTIALLDGFDANGRAVPRQNVVDYFTMTPSRMEEDKSSTYAEDSETPFRTANRGIRVNLNPPRAVIVDNSGKVPVSKDDGYNLRPIAAALNGCPLREWRYAQGGDFYVDWDTALKIAETVGKAIDHRPDDSTRGENYAGSGLDSGDWNEEKAAWGISFLGRRPPNADDAIPKLLRQGSLSKDVGCDFDREGVIRNSSDLFTTRQQLFTILLKADSFTPKVGYTDAEHGTSLASVQAIAHVWRDPEPLRNGAGEVILDPNGNPSHSWVLLDMYEF